MKTSYHKLILLLLMAAGLASCTEKPWREDEFKKVLDSIEGTYEWTSCTWEGPEVDMDNDGISSKDFWTVFHKFDNCQQTGIAVQPARFDPSGMSMQSYYIICLLPFQCYDRRDYIFPVVQQFGTRYQINDGKIELEETLHEVQIDPYLDILKMGKTRQIRQTGYAQLEIQLDLAVYDYATHQWAEGRIIHQFKRKHY